MNKTQTNYIMAQGLYRELISELTRRCEVEGIEAMYEIDFDAAFEKEEEIVAELGTNEAYELMVEAEKQLVEWCFEAVDKHPLYKKNLGELEPLREKVKTCLVTREKIAKLALKLAA